MIYDVVDAQGTVVNQIVLDDPTVWAPPEGCTIRETQGAFKVSTDVFPVPSTVPQFCSRRQMLLGLAAAGFITTAEAVAAATTGAVPSSIQAVFDTLPDQASKDTATITWAAMSQCDRGNSLVAMLQQSHSLTDAQVDDLFRSWVTL